MKTTIRRLRNSMKQILSAVSMAKSRYLFTETGNCQNRSDLKNPDRLKKIMGLGCGVITRK